ncbi:MAG TPA: polysaccharide deacetylase family protein, partial [Polyangiaceae bacterium]
HPAPPVWLTASELLGYATLCTLGVLVPQWQMYGDVWWRVPPGRQSVALTFDDGPHPATTRMILEILARGNHRATFFLVGEKVERYPDVAREICRAGHEIGLHGFVHDRLYSLRPPSFVAEDIDRAGRAIEAACGVRTRLFRPPVGYVSHRTASGARRAGVRLVAWSARGIDGVSAADPERVAERVGRQLRDGAIILLHDASEREDFEPASIRALPKILEAIEALGFKSIRVSELIAQ